MRVVDMFRFHAREYPEREFSVHRDWAMSYGEADDLVLRIVTALREDGISRDNRVGVLTVNCIEFVACYLACALVGCVPVPLNYRLVSRELAYILEDSAAKLILASRDFVPLVEDARTNSAVRSLVVLSDDAPAGWRSFSAWTNVAQAPASSLPLLPGSIPAVQSYTSGTTGRPKGVLMSNDAMAWYAETQGAPLHARRRARRAAAGDGSGLSRGHYGAVDDEHRVGRQPVHSGPVHRRVHRAGASRRKHRLDAADPVDDSDVPGERARCRGPALSRPEAGRIRGVVDRGADVAPGDRGLPVRVPAAVRPDRDERDRQPHTARSPAGP